MAMFYEANIANLLETILFASCAVEALQDAAIDLADYAVRQLSFLCSEGIESHEIMQPGSSDLKNEESIEEELVRLEHKTSFEVSLSMACCRSDFRNELSGLL